MFFWGVILAATLFVHGATTTIQTEDVELGYQGTYDNSVHIRRNAAGDITFQDSDHLTGVTLSDLLRPAASVGRVIRVAKSGGEYDTIAAGLAGAAAMNPTADSRVTVLVHPGTYAEQRLEIPDYVNLVGTDRDACVISMTSTDYDGTSAITSALVAAPGNSSVEDLTIHNTRSGYPSTALAAGWGWSAGTTSGKTIRISDCIIGGSREDVLYTVGAGGGNAISVMNCHVWSTGGGDVWSCYVPAGSSQSIYGGSIKALGTGSPAAAFWMTGGGSVRAYGTEWMADSSSSFRGAFRFSDSLSDGGSLYLYGGSVEAEDGTPGRLLEAQTTGTGWKVYTCAVGYAAMNTVPGVTVHADGPSGGSGTFDRPATFQAGFEVPGDRVVEVAPDGSREYTTIASGLAAASAMNPAADSRVTVLIYPGTYAEQRLEVPDYVHLVGTDRDACIISMVSTGYDGTAAPTSALVGVHGNASVSNLTIHNKRAAYPSVAVALGWDWSHGTASGKTISANNCVLMGVKEDVLYTIGDNRIRVQDCQVTSTNGIDSWCAAVHDAGYDHAMYGGFVKTAGAGVGNCIWMTGAGSIHAYGTRFIAYNSDPDQGVIRFSNQLGVGAAYFSGCAFEDTNGGPGRVTSDSSVGNGFTVGLRGCSYEEIGATTKVTVLTEDMGDGAKSFGGEVTVGGGISVAGPASLGDLTAAGRVEAGGGLSVGGTTVVDAARNVSASTVDATTIHSARVSTVTYPTSRTLTVADMGKTIVCSADGASLTLPEAGAGYACTVVFTGVGGRGAGIVAASGDSIHFQDSFGNLVTGNPVSTSKYSTITLVAVDDANWVATMATGSWGL